MIKLILSFFLTLLALIFYQAFKPLNLKSSINYKSIPTYFPNQGVLDNPNCDVLTKCDDQGSCKACGAENDISSDSLYECTLINPGENVIYKLIKL